METSETVADIFAALTKAQAEFQPIKEDAKNVHLGYRYTTLAAVLDATRATLAANGLGVIQGVESHPERSMVAVITTLIHTSGQWVRSTLGVPYVPQKPLSPAQTMGVAITYARRYALMAMLGISSGEEDTDAAVVQGEGHTQDKQGAKAQREPETEESKAQRAAWLKQQLEGFKDTLQTTQTESDVHDTVNNLLGLTGELPPKLTARVNDLAKGRIAWLTDHPPTGFGKDTPNEEDSAAVNAPETKPNGAADPLVYELDSLRGKIRKATALNALDDIARVLDGLYQDKGDAIFSNVEARTAWEAATEFLSARRKFIEQGNGA